MAARWARLGFYLHVGRRDSWLVVVTKSEEEQQGCRRRACPAEWHGVLCVCVPGCFLLKKKADLKSGGEVEMEGERRVAVPVDVTRHLSAFHEK